MVKKCKLCLEVGDLLEVRLDRDSAWLDDWITVKVLSISICHNSRKDPNELDPFIFVHINHPQLTAFNYTMYCQYGAVRRIEYRDEMTAWFHTRTRMHIDLFKKYVDKIIDLGLPDVIESILLNERETHDCSKFVEPEYTPYIHLTWRYKLAKLGQKYEVDTELEQQMQEVTFQHVKDNSHHPEYWDKNITPQHLNSKDRDSPSVLMTDATSMPLSYVAAMVADWLAVSEERGTDVNDWIKNNVNIRWKFTVWQVFLIKEIVRRIV
jgi:hypothetical protein